MRAIDADALIEILTTAIRTVEGMAKFLGAEDDPEIKMEIKAYTDILEGVKEQPTIEAERKKGADNGCTFLMCRHGGFGDDACSKCMWAYRDMYEPDEEGAQDG